MWTWKRDCQGLGVEGCKSDHSFKNIIGERDEGETEPYARPANPKLEASPDGDGPEVPRLYPPL
uniref:Uncharacterized protein n=1 Tax=Arundo donax TaxID=35708 RepID=A0A0A9HT67_ARUDO